MLTVTQAALNRLSTKLARKNAIRGAALRLTRTTGGWLLGMDQARPGDTTFSHEGKDVLLLDATVAKAMAALILDVHATKSGARLKLHRTIQGSD